MDKSMILLTPCPPPDYKNPFVRARGNIHTKQLDYFLTKEYSSEVFSNPAFRTSQRAVGDLMYDRFKELVIEGFCPYILKCANMAVNAPIIAMQMLTSIPYEGSWKVHYHLVLEVRELIHTFIYYYHLQFYDPKNPQAPPFTPKKPEEPKPEPKPYVPPKIRAKDFEPNPKNPFSLPNEIYNEAVNQYMDYIRPNFAELKGLTKVKAMVEDQHKFFAQESPELEEWLRKNDYIE